MSLKDPTAKEKVLIEVKGLTTTFRNDGEEVAVIQDIDFEVMQGETLGIVGESGSGKTVTCYSITRLLPSGIAQIAKGAILFDGQDIASLPEDQVRRLRGNRIAMIFQEPMSALNPVHRCGAQIDEMLRLHTDLTRQERYDKVIALMQKVRLPEPEKLYKAYPHQLSGGQLQRIMIAMAISCEPDLLIADEPTTALDVTVQKEVIHLLRELQAETGMAMIFISHDLGVISEIADRVLVMQHGRIVEEGPVRSIIQSPQEPYTQGLVACRPPTTYRLDQLPTVQEFLKDTDLTITKHKVGHLVSAEAYSLRQELLADRKVLVEVRGLTKDYGGRGGLFSRGSTTRAVDGVTFDIRQGETLGLVGESGCGKSTLGKVMLRLLPATNGQVLYDGTDLLTINNRQMRTLRKQVQMIFQDPYASLNPKMTVGRAVEEPMHIHRLHGSPAAKKDRVIHLLEQVGLSSEHFQRYPHQFSGGQRQRICIARALAVEPDFIICDESVSALDVSVQAQVLNLLNDLKAEYGLTYLFISHDLSVVKHFSDRIMVMQAGAIEEIGDAEQVFHAPVSSYTQRLLDSIPGRHLG